MAGKMWISVLGSAALLAVGLTGWMVTQSNGQAPAPEAASVVVDLPPLTQEALRQTLEARLKTVQARMSGATEGTLAALLQEQDALARAVANPALTLQKTEANRRLLVETLSDFGAHPSGEAAVALGAGDLVGAAPLFAGIRAQAEADLRRAAKAAFALGQIQLAQGNGVGAAGYLLRAADLDARAPYLREAERVALQAGNTAAALNLGPRLLSVTLAEYGENSTEHAEALSQIGQTLLVAGRVKDAEAVFRDAVAVGAKGPDPASEGQAQRLNNLAALLRATGNAAEAEPLFRQAIDIDRAAPNGAYADAPVRLGNLAELLAATDRADEALALFLAAVQASRQVLGATHPDHAPRLMAYANVLRAANRPAEAVPLYLEAAESMRAALGPYHPDLLSRLDAVAGALRASGDQAAAEQMYRELLDRTAARLGKTHADYGRALNNLGLLLRDTDRKAEAEAAFSEAIGVLTATLGAEHADTRTVAANLEAMQAKAP